MKDHQDWPYDPRDDDYPDGWIESQSERRAVRPLNVSLAVARACVVLVLIGLGLVVYLA